MLKVVLADDEKKVVLLMQKLIDWQALGYEIVGVANDGLHALELVQEKQPHLLISDIRMPGCDGLELIRKAKELQPGLHFIVISGYRQFEYAQSAIKYGVEDYLLKPLKQEEMNDILLRIKDKLGQEAELAFRLKKGSERQQDLFVSALMAGVERQKTFLNEEQAATEFGMQFGKGSYLAVLVKPDISRAEQYLDGYQIMIRHSLEIVRREVALMADEFAASAIKEGIAVVLYFRDFQTVECKQRFTKIRNEIEKQRDVFWDIRCTICLGARRDSLQQIGESMREALWLCRDRLCRSQPWRDAESEPPVYHERYQMDPSQKKRLQDAAEYLDVTRIQQEQEASYHSVLQSQQFDGQMLADWFNQVLEAGIFGIQQNGPIIEGFAEEMEERFWRCTDTQDVFQLLSSAVLQEMLRLKEEKALRESRPIAEAKHYIQQHFHESIRLEDVSNAVGFNATYFSALFKKETGQNFVDYLTALRINKSKALLCREGLSVQDVAEMVGYSDLKYFSRLFKKITGVSPSDYKKMYK